MTQETQKGQATTILKKNIEHLPNVLPASRKALYLDWEPKCVNNIYHVHNTVLSNATGLGSPKSLASNRASFLDLFSSIGFHLFCVLVHGLCFALQY